MLSIGTEEDFLQILFNILSLNQSITPDDKKTVEWFIDFYGPTLPLPAEIPFKETLAMLAAHRLENVPVKTPTDVLRIIAYMSYGSTEIKLPPKKIKANAWHSTMVDNPERDKMKFRKFSTEEVHYLLNLLDSTGASVEEMAVYKKRWIRVGEKLHPGKYSHLYPKTFKAFDILRNKKARTWYGKLDAQFKKGFETGVEFLSKRPGEYLRRLDWMVRSSVGDKKRLKLVLNTFKEVAKNASNKVLYSLYGHFSKRDKQMTHRSVTPPKGKRTMLPLLDPLPKEVVKKVKKTIKKVLMNKFSQLPALGITYIDPELKKVAIPTDMRSMEDSLIVSVRGSRVKIGMDNPKVIRFFVHWDGGSGRTDHDLSAVFVTADNTKGDWLNYSTPGLKMTLKKEFNNSGNLFDHVNTNKHKKGDIFAVHSGDVRNRPGPCAEYVDIDIEKTKAAGYRYIMMTVHDYTGRGIGYHRTVCGFMSRAYPESNDTWVPKTVENSIKLTSTEKNIAIMLFDIETLEYIMINESMTGIPVVWSNPTRIQEFINTYAELPEFSIYHLLKLHAEARGELVETPQHTFTDPNTGEDIVIEAETLFMYEDFINDYAKLAEYMGV
jgi:hypothetical protein